MNRLFLIATIPLALSVLVSSSSCKRDDDETSDLSERNNSSVETDDGQVQEPIDLSIQLEKPIFADISAEVGLDFVHEPGKIGTYFFPEIMCAGGAFLDFDQDGDLDIYLTNGNFDHDGDDSNDTAVMNRLYEQQDDGSFVDVTERSGLGDTGYGMGVAIGDVNNDKYPDVYVTNYGADQLYVNNRDGTFLNVTESAGIDNLRWSASATFVDFDQDGWLDLYVTNYVNYFPERECDNRNGQRGYCSPASFLPTMDKLYRNLGFQSEWAAVKYEDVTVSSGIGDKRGPGLGVTAGDFNGDGWADLYVANDGAANFLWINQQDGTFVDESVFRGTALDSQGKAQAGMGIASSDLNEDGLPDLLVTHLAGESNAFYVSSKSTGGDFQETAVRKGLGTTSFGATGFGVAFIDLEHDGDEDVVLVNGKVSRLGTSPALDGDQFWNVYAETNQILLNNGEDSFETVTAPDDVYQTHVEVSRALCYGDIDNDGDLDLLVVNAAGPARLYRNDSEKQGHWLMLRVLESEDRSGRNAYGAQVRLLAEEDRPNRWLRFVNPGSSYCSSHDPRIHFGLGDTETIQSVEVTWADGAKEVFDVGAVDREITIQRGKGVEQ